MAASVAAVDGLIKEYLIFRGFTSSVKTFESDLKIDRNKSFKIERIVDQFLSYIQSCDIGNLRRYWRYFDKAYFCHLGHGTYKIVRKLETSVLRFYVIHAVQTGKNEKVIEFFEKYVSDLQHDESWKEWFALPFLKNPEQNKMFALYFTKIWQDSVVLSLTNCFDTIFSHISLPCLLDFEREKREIEYLRESKAVQDCQIIALQAELEQSKKQKFVGKSSVETQTDAVTLDDTEIADSSKKNRKSPSSKPRLWKILAPKDKDIPKTLIEKTKNSDSKATNPKSTQILNSSLDETVFKQHVTPANASNLKNSQSLLSKYHETSSSSSTSSLPDNQYEPFNAGSTFYTSVDEHSTPQKAENRPSFFKSRSVTTFSMDNSSTDIPSYYGDHTSDIPFIVLSQDEFKEHNSSIVSCKFSDNNNLVGSLDINGIMKVWQCYPSVSPTSLISLNSDLCSFDWLPNKQDRIVLGKSNGQISLYDTSTRKTLWDATVSLKYKRIISVLCNPFSATCACSALSVSNDKKVVQKSSSNQKFIRMKEYTSFGNQSSKLPGCLTVYDLNTGQLKSELCLEPFPVCIHSLSYNHNGTLLLTGGADGMVRMFDIRNNDCLIGWHAHSTNVLDVIFDPDETSMYSIGADGKVCVWDINKVSSKIAEFPLDGGSSGINYYADELNLNNDAPYGKLLECDADGQHMMTCAPSGLMIYKIKPKTKMDEVMHILSPKSEAVTLDWTSSPNCSTAMCGTKTGEIQISTLLKK